MRAPPSLTREAQPQQWDISVEMLSMFFPSRELTQSVENLRINLRRYASCRVQPTARSNYRVGTSWVEGFSNCLELLSTSSKQREGISHVVLRSTASTLLRRSGSVCCIC
jgi:hypothetical protein